MKADAELVFQHTRHVPRVLGLVCGCVAYCLAHALDLPGPRYLPEAGEWAMTLAAGEVAIGYYTVLLYGLAGVVVGSALGKVFGARLGEATGARALTFSAAAITIATLAYLFVVELA